jgi:hypothetical protein
MKIIDIINEDSDSGSYGGNSGAKGTPGKLRQCQADVIKAMDIYPEMPGYYYDMYRFGVHMAGSPDDHHPMDKRSAAGNHLTTLAYTSADQEIINKSKKAMGLKNKRIASDKSTEPNDTNTVSPIAKPKKNKYGV